MTANLQLTVKQRAQLMNVSERLVYMAGKVVELRPDLEAEIMAGRITVNKAYRIATGTTPRPRRCPHCGGVVS